MVGPLWYKLYHIGVRCKLLQVIKSMYLNVTICVQVDGYNSNYFTHELGIMQGECKCLLYFFHYTHKHVYVNDCEMAFINSSSIPLEVKDLNLFLLMYADDMVIFSESISGLQNMLDTLCEYIKYWCIDGKYRIYVARLRNGESESFQPFRVEPHKFYIYRQYTNIVFIL